MKRQIRELWWRAVVQSRDDVVGIEAAVITNPAVWRASGHVDHFTDPLVDCLECRARVRSDHIEDGACPSCGAVGRFTEERELQPALPHLRRPGRAGLLRRLPAPRDGAGDVRQLRERADLHPPPAAVRDRADRALLPQRDHPGAVHLPDARVRADGDGVLLRPLRVARLAPLLEGGAAALVPGDARRRPGAAPPARPRGPTSSRTTPRRRPTSSSASPGAGASSRASRTAATTTCARTPAPPAGS